MNTHSLKSLPLNHWILFDVYTWKHQQSSTITQRQVLQPLRQLHMLHALVELIPQGQLQQIAGQQHPVQASIEGIPEGQNLQVLGELHRFLA